VRAFCACLLQRGSIGDTLTALFPGQGREDERRRTAQARVHGASRLDGNERIHAGLVQAAAKRAAGLGQDKGGLSRIALGVWEATGRHDGTVGPQAMAALLIGGTPCMLAQLSGAQDAERHGPSTTGGFFRQPCVATLRDGTDQRRPGQGVSPLTDGMHDGYKLSALQAGSSIAQPMLEITNNAHHRLSGCKGEREPQDTMRRATSQVPMSMEKTSDHYFRRL